MDSWRDFLYEILIIKFFIEYNNQNQFHINWIQKNMEIW